jgi:hypothetical protein
MSLIGFLGKSALSAGGQTEAQKRASVNSKENDVTNLLTMIDSSFYFGITISKTDRIGISRWKKGRLHIFYTQASLFFQ